MSWYATTLDLNTGAISSGALTDTYADDTNELVLTEVGATPGFDYDFTFTGVPNTNLVLNLAANYDGSGIHNVKLFIYNNNTTVWDAITGPPLQDLPANAIKQYYQFVLPDTPIDDYLNGGVLKIKIEHVNGGNAAHQLHIDFMQLAYQFAPLPATARIAPVLSANANIVYVIEANARIAPSIPANALITDIRIGHVYAIGGYSPSGYTGANEALAVVENAWYSRTPLSTPRTKLAVATDEERPFAFGGLGDPDAVSRYDPVPQTWTELGDMTRQLFSHGAVGVSISKLAPNNQLEELKSLIFVMGGKDQATTLPSSDNAEYDPDTDTFTSKTNLPLARQDFGYSAVNNEKIYATGGTPNYDTNYEYDPLTDAWTVRTILPTGRDELAASGNTEANFTFNGSQLGISQKLVEKYLPVLNLWVTETPPSIARGKLTSSICMGAGEQAAVLGGLEIPPSCTNGVPSDLAETYDTLAESWVRKTDMPTARQSLGSSHVMGVSIAISYRSLQGNANIQPSNKYIEGNAKILTSEIKYISADGRIRPIITATANISRVITGRAYILGIEIEHITSNARISPTLPADAKIKQYYEQTITGDARIGTMLTCVARIKNLRIRAKARIRPSLSCVARIRPRITSKARIRPRITANAKIIAVWERTLTGNARIAPVISGVARIQPSIGSDARISPTIPATAKIVIYPTIEGNGHILTLCVPTVVPAPTMGTGQATISCTGRIGFDCFGSNIGKVYVSGGWRHTYDNKKTVHEVFEALHNFWFTVQPLPKRKAQHGVGSSELQITMYALGGASDEPDTDLPSGEKDNLEYNPDYNVWTTKTSLTIGRRNNAVTNACDFNGYEEIFSIGGRAEDTGLPIGNNDAYDPATDSWTTKTGITARDRLAAAYIQDNFTGALKIYATGGENAVNTNEEYDVLTDSWTSKAGMTQARQEHASTFVQDGVFNYINVSGGLDNYGNPISSIESYLDTLNVWVTDVSWTTLRDRIVAETVHTNSTRSPVAIMAGGGDYKDATEEYSLSVGSSWLIAKADMITARADAGSGFVRGIQWYAVSRTLSANGRVQPSISARAEIVGNIPLYAVARIIPSIGANARVRPVISADARVRPVISANALIRTTNIFANAYIVHVIEADARIQPTIGGSARLVETELKTITSNAKIQPSIPASAVIAHLKYSPYPLRANGRISVSEEHTIDANGRIRPYLTSVFRIQPSIKANGRIQVTVEETVEADARIRPVITANAFIAPYIKAKGRIRPIITVRARIAPSIGASGRIQPSIGANANVAHGIVAIGRIQPSIRADARVKVLIPHSETIQASAFIRFPRLRSEAIQVYWEEN